MNIHTQLNVYTRMYLSRTVFINWAKRGKTFLPITSTIWSTLQSPPPHPLLHRRQELHTCHTRKHTRIYTKSSNAQLTVPETIFKKFSVNKQNPNLQQWQETDANMDFCFKMDVVVVTLFPSYFVVVFFVMDANYASLFLHQPNSHSTLQVGENKKKNAVSKTLKIVNCRSVTHNFYFFFSSSFIIVP